MILTLTMVLGGPLLWWILVRTAGPLSPVRRTRARIGLALLLGAGVVLFVVPVYSTTNTVATAVWLAGGLLTAWATRRSGSGGDARTPTP
ncbi:hypothetical protein [Micromonospora echinofusca]|uniref:Uncharacterized protein n=1 Tax=Micromonospora echinofusca TaxID=47858 RepID=A0ABS3VT38_MICEH|nr:hypothetical protein [Micromonospora echinofusca]MBO4207660.1 hypothetical protein [Micromonospora echinofusca]